MLKHTKIYYKHFNLSFSDIPMCEKCSSVAVDIHHIYWRRITDADSISNLIALCRDCHQKAHFLKVPYLSKEELIIIHNAKI